MKIEIDIEILVDDMLTSLKEDGEENVEHQLKNYWSIILLDNIPAIEDEITLWGLKLAEKLNRYVPCEFDFENSKLDKKQ